MFGLRGIEIKPSWVDYCNKDPSCGYPHAPLTKPFVAKTGISNLDFETIILMPSFIDWVKRERNRLAYGDRQIFSFCFYNELRYKAACSLYIQVKLITSKMERREVGSAK